MKSNQQKFESLENTYSGTNYLDKIAISQRRTGQDYDPNSAKVNEKKTIFKGGHRKRKRISRQYLYLYNDHHKRRSKVSKTQNLRASRAFVDFFKEMLKYICRWNFMLLKILRLGIISS